MDLNNDSKHQKTLQILRGEINLSPMFLEFKTWLKYKFNITVYNVILEETKDENDIEIYIFLSTKDFNCMMKSNFYEYNKIKQKQISMAFAVLLKKYNEFKYYDKSIRVIYREFSKEVKSELNNQVAISIKSSFEMKYAQYFYWNVYPINIGVVVFFYRNKDVKDNKVNGVSGMMRKDYFNELKVIDEFNFYNWDDFIITFDSKENLDKNFNGNIYAYAYK